MPTDRSAAKNTSKKRVQTNSITFFFDDELKAKMEAYEKTFPAYAKLNYSGMIKELLNRELDLLLHPNHHN